MPVEIPYYILLCSCCKNEFKLLPIFITKGTTLTLAAQALVTIAYHENNKNTWRKIHKELCHEKSGISHTTLYRGYHALGKNLVETQILLSSIYPEIPSNIVMKKAVRDQTLSREEILVRVFFTAIIAFVNKSLKNPWSKFWRIFEDVAEHMMNLYTTVNPLFDSS